jgi:hydroxyquinol 1,2-dioxygenase
VFRRDDRYLDSDAVFGVRSTLIADWQRNPPGRAPYETECPVPFYTLNFKFVLDAA